MLGARLKQSLRITSAPININLIDTEIMNEIHNKTTRTCKIFNRDHVITD